jgi:hypothetical protein
MADLKISQLTSATLPLAGTEVLPIVQSSSTKKVATDDLTVKNVRSNATTGILQIAGPGAGTTRTMTTPDANFTAARTDAAQSFTGDQTLGTGNLVQGTAAKGINFTANTPAAGMTSQLLNWYEEGTWTPSISAYSGTITSTSSISGTYTRVGRQVTVIAQFTIVNNGTGSVLLVVSGLPFTGSSSPITLYSGSGVCSTTNKQLVAQYTPASSSNVNISYSDGTYPGANSSAYSITMTYFV